TRRRVLRQRFYLDSYRFAVDFYLAPLTKLAKWIGKKWIGERVVQIEQVEWRTRPWRTWPSWDQHLRLCLNRPDFKFSRVRRSDCSLKCHNVVGSAANRLQILSRLLQFLRGKSLPADFGTLDQPWARARIESELNLNRDDFANEGALFGHNQFRENQLARAVRLRVLTRARGRRTTGRIGNVQCQFRCP